MRNLTVLALAVSFCGGTGCTGNFERPGIILDLRVLGLRVDPPEVVVDFDPENPPMNALELEIPEVRACALVADPDQSRRLFYSWEACPSSREGRCEPNDPVVNMGDGFVDDPEESDAPVEMCAPLQPTSAFVDVFQDAVSLDSLVAFGGVALQLSFVVVQEDGTRSEAQFGTKRALFSPRIPASRVANKNPQLDFVQVEREDDTKTEAPLGRCGSVDPILVEPDEAIVLRPIETEGVREEYSLPTFDGDTRDFTENLTYSYFATDGEFNRETTGGPKDFAGNDPPLHSRYTAPPPEKVGDGLNIQLWLVQRDERGGSSWYQTCLRVEPTS